MLEFKFKEWLLSEGINYIGLTKMWKKFHPQEEDSRIKQQIDMIASVDPTPNKEYTNWLAREFLNKRIRLPEDQGIIQPDLIYFNDLKKRNQLKRLGVESNIDTYTRHQFQDKVDELRVKISGKSKRQELEDIKTEGAEKLYQDGQWMVIKATTPGACIAYGKGTRWCTASTNKDNMANHYLQDGPIYIIWKNKEPFAQLHLPSQQFMDVTDRQIEKKEIPEDLKNILFKVVELNNENDEINIYKVTGHLTDKLKLKVEQGTKTLKLGKTIVRKITNSLAASVFLNFNEPIRRPIYFLEGTKIYWDFYPVNSEGDFGYLMLNNNEIMLNPYGHFGRLPENIAKDISENWNYEDHTSPEWISIAMFLLTHKTNPKSDEILKKFVKSWDLESLNKLQNNKFKPEILGTILYFSKSNHPEIFEIAKRKLQKLENEINNTNEDEDDLKNLSPRIAKMVSRNKKIKRKKHLSSLDAVHNLLTGTNNRSPEVMQHFVDMASKATHENYLPFKSIYQYWASIVNSLYKRDNDNDYRSYDDDDLKPTGEAPPWGKDGWLEAEPYIAKWAAVHSNGYGGRAFEGSRRILEKYANLTSNPKETEKRMSELFLKAAEEWEEYRNNDNKEEDESWK